MSDKQVCNGGICIPENFKPRGLTKPPEWADDVLRGIASRHRITAPALIIIAPQKRGQYGGRYFVDQNVIVLVDSGNMSRDRTVLVHESTHAALTRGSMTLGRGHRGQHDSAFYEYVETMYREFGVPLSLALTVEDNVGVPTSWYKRATWAR